MSICKECFHSYVCEKFNEHRECDNEKCHFANDHFVSADLINRQNAEIEEQDSEIARLKGILDCYARQYGTVRCYTEGKDED